MPAPPVHTNGRNQLDEQRPATAETIQTDKGPIVARTPRGPASWLPEAAELEPEILRDQELEHIPAPPKQTRVPATRAGSRKTLRLTQQALALRVQGLSMLEIGQALGVAPSTVTGWFATHRRQVASGAIETMLDEIAVPIAAENLVQGLLAGDKDYTLETLKGRGQLKRHTAGDARPPGDLPALSIIFEAPVAVQVNTAGLPQGKILGSIAPPRAESTVASSIGGEDHDAIDVTLAEILPSGQPALAHTRTDPVPSRIPTELGIGQPAPATEP